MAYFSRVCVQQTWFSVFRVLEVVEGCVRRVAACLRVEGSLLVLEVGWHSWGDWPSTGAVGLAERGWICFYSSSSLYRNTQYLKSDHLSSCWL